MASAFSIFCQSSADLGLTFKGDWITKFTFSLTEVLLITALDFLKT